MMKYKLFGRSGLRVSELCLGTMTFGESWGWGASEDECRKLFDIYVNAGGNFIDTANRYTDGLGSSSTGSKFELIDRAHLGPDGLWRLANARTVWGDLFNRPVCGLVRSGNNRE